jgi:hypothetical protein
MIYRNVARTAMMPSTEPMVAPTILAMGLEGAAGVDGRDVVVGGRVIKVVVGGRIMEVVVGTDEVELTVEGSVAGNCISASDLDFRGCLL